MTWNETHLESPEGPLDDPIDKSYLIGATLIGVPQFMFARTPFVSWGITALYPDVMDLFVEEVDEAK